MAFKLHWKVVIDVGNQRKELVLVAPTRCVALAAACKAAENMGGDFTDIGSCELTQDYDGDASTPNSKNNEFEGDNYGR